MRQTIDVDERFENFDYVRWSVCCRMMSHRIALGQFEGAHAGLRDFCRQPRIELATSESSVAAVFETRIANALENGGYFDVDSVRMADDEELQACGNIGQKAISEIRETVEQVMAGQKYESYGEDAEELIDWDCCARAVPGERKAPETTGGNPMASNEERVREALELLASSPDTVADAVQASIDEHEKEIARHKREIAALRRIQNTFATKTSGGKRESGWGKGRDWSDVIEQIRVYVKLHGPSKPGVIAEHIGLTRMQVGSAIKHTELLQKDDRGRVELAKA